MFRYHLAAALTVGALAGPAMAQDDLVADGEQVFKRCAACHQVGDGAQNRVGPELNAVVGRTAGSLEGFRYSDAMVEAGEGGLVWDEATLDEYLENPRAMIKGTKMAFAGLRDEADRAAVIAYLQAQGGSM